MSSYPVNIYKLYNKVQNYDWGTKNEDAFIPKLLGVKYEPDLPYAELWIGAHTKSPSTIMINGNFIPLNDVIKDNPELWLGREVSSRFDNQLPFLLKVLSANQALSIQTHPDKVKAKEMHKLDPVNYPDENHKPEIAIALDGLYALVGLKPFELIKNVFEKYPGFKMHLPKKIIDKLYDESTSEEQRVLNLYKELFVFAEDTDEYEKLVNALVEDISKNDALQKSEEQFLANKEVFGIDVGLLSFFFFNFLELTEEEAFFTDAGIPHAYLKGNIIECMANSDNVIRAGLTPKYKDVDTLLDVIQYANALPEVIKPKDGFTRYKTSVREFEVNYLKLEGGESILHETNNRIHIGIITDGEVIIKSDSTDKRLSLIKGESFIIPGKFRDMSFYGTKSSKVYFVTVPDEA